jgi:peptide deformylase
MNIIQIGNSLLRNTAKTIADATDSEIIQLANDLITTAESANGVGIAAPQVAQSYRLFIMASRPSIRYPHAPKMSPTAVVNPVIVSRSDEMVKDWEGCLSVPNLRGLIPRHREIEVEYTSIDGEVQHQVLTDFVARIFQHELDHLDGILFIDRLETMQDLYSEEEYQKQVIAQL